MNALTASLTFTATLIATGVAFGHAKADEPPNVAPPTPAEAIRVGLYTLCDHGNRLYLAADPAVYIDPAPGAPRFIATVKLDPTCPH